MTSSSSPAKELGRQIFQAYEEFAFHKVYHLTTTFVLDLALSPTSRRTLYCSYPNDPSRRATRVMSSFSGNSPDGSPSPLRQRPEPCPLGKGREIGSSGEDAPSTCPDWKGRISRPWRDHGDPRERPQELELRRAKEIGDFEADVTITSPRSLRATSALHGFMKSSWWSRTRVIRGDSPVAVTRCGGVASRCWNYPPGRQGSRHPDLCPRCAEAVKHCER